jgi:hypothetical protein
MMVSIEFTPRGGDEGIREENRKEEKAISKSKGRMT